MEDYDKGFQLGVRVEYRVAVEAVATALLEILGKDAGDGYINLGAAGWWGKRSGRWEQVKCAHAYLSPGDHCSICGETIYADYREGVRGATK